MTRSPLPSALPSLKRQLRRRRPTLRRGDAASAAQLPPRWVMETMLPLRPAAGHCCGGGEERHRAAGSTAAKG